VKKSVGYETVPPLRLVSEQDVKADNERKRE
jgi:hypothetical protein